MGKGRMMAFPAAAMILVCLLTCTGCGEEETELVVPGKLQEQGEGDGQHTDGSQGVSGQRESDSSQGGSGQQEPDGSRGSSGQQEPGTVISLSYEEETILYEGEFPEKQVFAAGGDRIYMIGSTGEGSRLYFMEAGAAAFEESGIVFPKNKMVKKLAVDEEGNCHILLLSTGIGQVGGVAVTMVTGEAMEIWVAGKDGTLQKTIRASEEVRGLNPYSFVIGRDGRYYMDDGGKNVYVVDENGGLTASIELPAVEGMGMGADGRMYAAAGTSDAVSLFYLEQTGEQWKAVLSDCTLPAVQSQYSDLGPGREEEVWIFSKAGGLFVYQCNSGTLEQALTAGEYPCSPQDLIGYGILADGRMVCVYQKGEGTAFTYLPFYDREE